MTHTDAITRATRAFHKRQTGLGVMIEEPSKGSCDYKDGTVILRNVTVGELARYKVSGSEGRERFDWFEEAEPPVGEVVRDPSARRRSGERSPVR